MTDADDPMLKPVPATEDEWRERLDPEFLVGRVREALAARDAAPWGARRPAADPPRPGPQNIV